jgi:hypothetical protein
MHTPHAAPPSCALGVYPHLHSSPTLALDRWVKHLAYHDMQMLSANHADPGLLCVQRRRSEVKKKIDMQRTGREISVNFISLVSCIVQAAAVSVC